MGPGHESGSFVGTQPPSRSTVFEVDHGPGHDAEHVFRQ